MVAATTPPMIFMVVGKPWVGRKCLASRIYTMPPTQLPAAARPIATPIFRSSNQLISASVPEQNTIPMPKPVTRPCVSHKLQNAVHTLLVNSPMIINNVPAVEHGTKEAEVDESADWDTKTEYEA